jgi:cell division protein FtsQ|tara:strand:- start:290 stop:976 length:687 start_codon:yes stop_codon:yes gene_type:complete
MHQLIDKKNKIFIYLLFLFLLSSINNLALNKINFFQLKLNKIFVSGLSKESNLQIKNSLNELMFQNIFMIDSKKIIDILENNDLIYSYNVKKIYPNSIDIKIKKAELLALISKDGNFFYVGSNGKLVNFKKINYELPFLTGEIEINDIIEFIKLIKKSKIEYRNITQIYYFQSGRWDIKNKSDILIKLPSENLIKNLNIAYKIINEKNFKTKKIIDLRILNNIILKDE